MTVLQKRHPAFVPAFLLLLQVLAPNDGGAERSAAWSASFSLTDDRSQALERISADSLRGHLSFIASDTLQGRETPSAGLDLAAEYIAAQFRRAGLQPAGDEGYFQSSRWTVVSPNPDNFLCTIRIAGKEFPIPRVRFSMTGVSPLQLASVPLVKVSFDTRGLDSLSLMDGNAVVTELPSFPRERAAAMQMAGRRQIFLERLAALNPAVIVALERSARSDTGYFDSKVLRHPEIGNAGAARNSPVRLFISDPSLKSAFDTMREGSADGHITVRLEPPLQREVTLRNVVGALPGSDPALKDSYILLTAHYDHVGVRSDAEGDRISNGANDNGSGTVSILEIGSALAGLRLKPRRTIVFVAFFGEERGLLGSRYYATYPAFPIEKTIAALNLEQVGRPDSPDGDQRGRASLTGFDYSEMGEILRAAGELSGVAVYKHERNSDAYFPRSDNQALANLGIPAHTLCVAFDYPDYHGPGDHWDKIDYENMARTNRMVAIALLMLAESEQEPRWNASNPRTARYLKAWKDRRPR